MYTAAAGRKKWQHKKKDGENAKNSQVTPHYFLGYFGFPSDPEDYQTSEQSERSSEETVSAFDHKKVNNDFNDRPSYHAVCKERRPECPRIWYKHDSAIMRVHTYVHEQEIDYISMLQASALLCVSGHFPNETQQRDLKLPQSLFIMRQLPVHFQFSTITDLENWVQDSKYLWEAEVRKELFMTAKVRFL